MILDIIKPEKTRIGIYLTPDKGNILVCMKEEYCYVNINVGDVITKVNSRRVTSCKDAAKRIIASGPLLSIELDNNTLKTPLISSYTNTLIAR